MIQILSPSQCIIFGFLFLAMLITGVFLKKNEFPYTSFLFNLHKLLALGLVVLYGYYSIKYHLLDSLSTLWLVIIISPVTILLFVSGGMLNIEKHRKPLFTFSHRLGSVLFIIGIIILFIFK